jgi:tetratricopeptide (TPR) repeat protein/Zn-dependent protease
MLFQSLLAIFIVIALSLYPYIVTIWKINQRILTVPKTKLIEVENFPAEISEILAPYFQEFEAIEFELAAYACFYAGEENDPPLWGLLLRDNSSQHYACLTAIPTHQGSHIIFVEFSTFLLTGQLVLTTSAKKYGYFKPYPLEIKQHLVDASIQQLWIAHEGKIVDTKVSLVQLDVADFLERLRQHELDSLNFSIKNKRFYWVNEGEAYRFRIRTSVKGVFNAARDMHFPRKKVHTQVETSQPKQVQQEVQAFLANQAPKVPMTKKKRGWIALASFALFAAVYATRFDPKTLVIFLAALVLHEGGHLLAMIICGYRAPAVLFIPYLGALATARKDHASLSEKFWISLAGPLPGLILGVAIAVIRSQGHGPMMLETWYHEDNIWRNASFILIGLNLFNLLPIYPLDGGQIADLLVFSRNPYLGVVYKSIGVGLLLLLGLVNPLLLVFGLIMALSIPHTFRAARWFSNLSHELRDIPWQDDEASAQLIFTRLQSAPKLTSFQKDAIAGGIFESRRANTASWKLRLGLSLIYLLSLTTGIMGGLYALLPNMQAFSGMMSMGHLFQDPKQHMRENIKKETEAIQRNPKDLKAYERRGRSKLYLRDNQGVIADANAILAQDPKSIQAYRLRGRAYDQAGEEAKAKADEQKANQLQWLPEFQEAQASLKQNPKDVNAYLSRANAKEGLEDVKGAFQDLDLALKIEPKNVKIWVARAGLSQRRDDYQAALRDVNHAIALDPNSIDAYELRSELYDGQGDIEKSEADMAKIEQLYEKTPAAQAHPERLEQIKNLRSPSKQ